MEKLDCSNILRGLYEAERLSEDFSRERIVPDFAFNVLNPLGLLYRPIVDESYLEKVDTKPNWPENKPFAVCLTHDVDAVSSIDLRQDVRTLGLLVRNGGGVFGRLRSGIGFGISACKSFINYNTKDTLHCYEKWLNIEKRINGHSTFFFWPGWRAVSKHHHTDCRYDLNDTVHFDKVKCTVAEMIREIDRLGWEIGLHSSWYSYDDPDELKRQKDALEKVLGHDIVSVRQHYLHYDIRVTPAVHAQAGFMFDSTLGFNDNVGFRFGTCYPWMLYDLNRKQELPIMEIPLIIQDGAMLNPAKGMRLDQDRAFEYVAQLADVVANVGGILTLLWHPNHIIKPDWWALYIRTLEYLNEKKAWFCSVRGAGEWWKANNMKRKIT